METHYKFGYANVGAQSDLSDFGFKFLAEGYSEKTIRNIYDSYAGGATDIPVAVPSPFAILSLVKTAFDNAHELIINKDATIKIIEENSKEKLEPAENKNHNVLICREDMLNVFNTLDLAELTFYGIVNYIELGQDIIDTLKNKTDDERHANLGTVLDEYKKLDGGTFGLKGSKENFKFYLLKYGHYVIGGSSKATLFFPTRNSDLLKKVATDLNVKFSGRNWFNHDHIVRDKISGTYKSIAEIMSENFARRDFEFKKWIVQLLDSNDTSIGKYIKKIMGEDINGENIRQNIDKWKTEYNPQNLLTVDNIGAIIQNRIDVITIDGNQEKEAIRNIMLKMIESSFINNGISKEERDCLYNMVNSFVLNSMDISILKKQENELERQIKTFEIQSIFADYLVKVPYKVSDDFKVLELEGSYYLPPLTQKPEHFFDDIGIRSGQVNDTEIEVFSKKTGAKKIYGKKDGAPFASTGEGRIVEGNFNVALFPFVENSKEYRIQLVERIDESSTIKFNLRNKDEDGHDYFVRRKIDQDNDVGTTYVNLENDPSVNFPIINFQMVCGNDCFNIRLEPKFKSVKNTQNANFSFAVDFGTTNTHIAYSLNDKPPESFYLNNYVATLKDMSNDNEFEAFYLYLIQEFLPLKIVEKDDGGEYSFPLRTILFSDEEAARRNRVSNVARKTFKDIGVYNIPFGYGNMLQSGCNSHSNLKWHKEKNEYSHFLREIGLLLYTKVLLEGGLNSLVNTKIYFSYPLSLGKPAISNLRTFWEDFYKNMFLTPSTQDKDSLAREAIKEVFESCAPVYYYLKNRQKLIDIQDKIALCVDIGGGTTDCAALIREEVDGKNKERVALQSSFRFASNSIFGGTVDMKAKESAYNFNYLTEKYIDIYNGNDVGKGPSVLKQLKINNKDKMYGNKESIFEVVTKNNDSSEINSCLFLFDSTTSIPLKGEDKYAIKLKNDEQYKIVFLYYFSIIIYHLAKLVEKRYKMELDKPVPPVSAIIFSGNGSKVLEILGFSDANEKVLKEIVRDIFVEVGVLNETNKEIIIRFDPIKSKVLTAEGSLMLPPDMTSDDICKKTELYGEYINKDSKEEIDQIRIMFDSFNETFLDIINRAGRLENFEINGKSLEKFRDTIKNETKNIFTLVNSMSITKKQYENAMEAEKYVESPMIPFEMMIFTLFSSLGKKE